MINRETKGNYYIKNVNSKFQPQRIIVTSHQNYPVIILSNISFQKVVYTAYKAEERVHTNEVFFF